MESTPGKRVQMLREAKGYKSLTGFAEHTGVKVGTLSALEADKSSPSMDTLSKLLFAFPDLSLEWLVNGAGEMLRDGRALVPADQLPPAVPSRLEPTPPGSGERMAPMMLAAPNVEDMTPEQQANYYRIKAERAERKVVALERRVAEYEEVLDQQQAVQLALQAGGRPFSETSVDAADLEEERPFMRAESNPDYREVERQYLGFKYGSLR